MTQVGEKKWVEIRAAMIEAPFAFFEVEKETIFADSAQFEEAKFGITPKAFDAIEVVLPAREFVVVRMDAVVLVTAQDQALNRPSTHRCRCHCLRAPAR